MFPRGSTHPLVRVLVGQESSMCTMEQLPNWSFSCFRLGSGAGTSSWQAILESFVRPGVVPTVSVAMLAWFPHYRMTDCSLNEFILTADKFPASYGALSTRWQVNPLILASFALTPSSPLASPFSLPPLSVLFSGDLP